jgi:hypothetical protein
MIYRALGNYQDKDDSMLTIVLQETLTVSGLQDLSSSLY